MKTNDKNLKVSKNVKCRIAEIHELIEQIRIHLSEIRNSDGYDSIRYSINFEVCESKKYLERFEWQLGDLSNLFE
jgi:hypothetical protein